jgi:hypothetical protein
MKKQKKLRISEKSAQTTSNYEGSVPQASSLEGFHIVAMGNAHGTGPICSITLEGFHKTVSQSSGPLPLFQSSPAVSAPARLTLPRPADLEFLTDASDYFEAFFCL